jgi:hypothetical protein
MAIKADVEAEIRSLLTTETSSTRLSAKLFGPGGLIRTLYSTPDEKKAVLQSALFRDANRRVSDLQRAEIAKLESATSPLVASVMGKGSSPAESPSTASV